MGDMDGFVERVRAARRDAAALPRLGWGDPGPPDEATGERWDRGHVLGHTAEMLPYWTVQVRAVLGGATAMGRDEAGYAARRSAIDGSHEVGEDALVRRVEAGLDGLLDLLREMRDEDLGRRLTVHLHEGSREVDVRTALEQLLVGHVEEHLRQLAELAPSA